MSWTCLCCLACSVLGLIRYLPSGFIVGLPLLLSSLIYRVLYSSILGRLVYGAFELGVGVGHLLDLGLRLVGKLLQ